MVRRGRRGRERYGVAVRPNVLFFDDRGGFGPVFNATHAVGGAEIHLVQLAEFLARQGCTVDVNTHSDEGPGNGVCYWDSREFNHRGRVDTLIVVGCASLPSTCTWRQAFAFQVVDPRPHPERFTHLRGNATMVCVSEWQAGLFRALGHEAVVIPVPIPDEWYGISRSPVPGRHVCVSSWNKGARETIEAWRPEWGELAVGSPYSQPDDAEEICARKGVTWLGTLRGHRWPEALATGESLARVCTIGETFGVADVAAAAMGLRTHTLCTGDVGSLREVGASPYTDPSSWRESLRHGIGAVRTRDAEEFRASRVLPQWLRLIGG